MNFILKKYINKIKRDCLRLNFYLSVAATDRPTTAIIYNKSSETIILLNLQSDIFGGIPQIRAYLVNPPRYRWAKAEGFTLDQMLELKQENVFVEVNPMKAASYLL